jgi:hypothetical protein
LILSTFEYFRPGLWQGEIESKGAKERGGNGWVSLQVHRTLYMKLAQDSHRKCKLIGLSCRGKVVRWL